MARVLVVDDEPRYRELLGKGLERDGHETRTVATGREAIAVGTRYRPDVVVTDWMLKNHIHGLHVANVLRAVLPGTRTILMTGFPSSDLRISANEAQVCDFVEKPFDFDRMRKAVQNAATGPPGQSDVAATAPIVAMIEVDHDGSIRFANKAALELLDKTSAGRGAARLADVFPHEQMPNLDAARDRWIEARPDSQDQVVWHIRSQEQQPKGGRLLALRRGDKPQCVSSAVIEMLLELTEPRLVRWPFDGRILIVDDEALLRRTFVATLEGTGAGCYAAGSAAEAVRLLKNDNGIKFVVHDFNMPNTDTTASIETIKTIRPDVVIVGTSGQPRRLDFAAIGITHYLQKPWRPGDLIGLLLGRIGNCGECGLVLPLRRPKPGERPSSWQCAFCGNRYRAVFDDSASDDVKQNVHSADSR